MSEIKPATKTIATKREITQTSPKKTELHRTNKNITKESQTKSVNNDSFAVIETGGKQYKVSVGDTLKIEKILARTQNEDGIGKFKEGDKIIFDKILLIDDGKGITDVGMPYIAEAKVLGTLIEIGRKPKITVIKYKPKSRYFKKRGHRQPYFKVKIDKIL